MKLHVTIEIPDSGDLLFRLLAQAEGHNAIQQICGTDSPDKPLNEVIRQLVAQIKQVIAVVHGQAALQDCEQGIQEFLQRKRAIIQRKGTELVDAVFHGDLDASQPPSQPPSHAV